MARLGWIVLSALGCALAAAQPEKDAAAAAAYERLFSEVQRSGLERHFQALSAPSTRLAGSDGEAAALDYVESHFRKLGLLRVRREPFQVSIADPEARGVLTGSSGSWRAELHPLWPNLVRTSTCDVEGPLVYGRYGTLADLSGKRIDGAIVVLEFNSGANWRQAFKLGAKAVVFLEPAEMNRSEAEQKFSSAPLAAPRFYLPIRSAGPVLDAAFREERVRLVCRQRWVVRETYNVLGDLPGTDATATDERIVLAASADSNSVVPSLAPGASGAAGLAAMLRLAELAAARPGRRPMTFAAIAASGLSLQGWREYAERRLREGNPQFLHVTLDLDDGRSTLGAFARSWYADYRNETLDPVRNLTRAMRANADRIAPLHGVESGRFVMLDAANDSDGRTWRNTIFGKFAFACEPLMMAGINAITLATVETARKRVDTPFDRPERFDLEQWIRQVRTLACYLWHLTRDTSDPGELSNHKVPVAARIPKRGTLVSGFGTLEGAVVQFDPNQSFIADIPVTNALAVAGHSQKTMAGVRGAMIQRVDPSNAGFRFLGAQPSRNFWHLDPRLTYVAAYALDENDEHIVIAPTDGLFGQSADRFFRLTSSYRSLPIVVFPAVATNLFGLVDPHELKPFEAFGVFDPKADATPRNFSMALPAADPRLNSDQEDCAVLFLEDGAKFKLLMTSAYGEWRLVLTNASPRSPTGTGYVAARDQMRLADIPFLAARDLLVLNESRLRRFAAYRILSPELDELQRRARESLESAEAAQSRLDWVASEREARRAWGYALRAHPMIMGTVNDVVNGVLFYLALLVPFSYFAERLLFARRRMTHQLFVSLALFIGAFGLLWLMHPAFEIVSNPTMIFVAFVMGTLSLLVATFIIGKFEASLRDMRAVQTGTGHIDVGRMSVAMAAFNLGIANMRRRKARTALTTLTLIVMTFIVLSFTSIVPGLRIGESTSSHAGTYPGLLVRNPGLEPLQNVTYRAVENEFGDRASVVRRVWYYGADVADHGVLTVSIGGRAADVRAVVGLEPREQAVTAIDSALIPGGRWFREGERNVAVLPLSVAQTLRIGRDDVGKTRVDFAGQSMLVIGLADDVRLRQTMDLDGEAVLPADFSLSTKFQSQSRSSSKAFRRFLRLDPGATLIVPADMALSLGGEVRSVAVRFAQEEAVRPALESLMPRLRMNLYAAVPGSEGLEVRQFSILQATKSAGLGMVLVQMLIAAVFVLNTMVASVYERKREIGIFSSIGLAPNHIAVLFFAESCVYGVLGSVAGYFLAQGVAKFVLETGLAPGLYLNFSATSAVLAAALVLAVVLLSTIYPAKVAQRIAAPAYEQAIEGVPEGDHWAIPLPFRVSAEEAPALMRFFTEWMKGHEEHAVGDFVTSETELTVREEKEFELKAMAWLAPFDLGVSQRMTIEARPAVGAESVVELTLILVRESGEPENWLNVNRRFLTALRRQFLAWRTKPKRAAA